ncbi:hypothetical protein HMPREF9436_01792 [Faecalibacterium cf. prausnitzii KLE1255]|uniref:Uncharacterized protein n=1 Tax=Faecalibacterium cf. prausnitzii KLE1255 TaxID=748224 RepID=E2ZJE4_9FIRM|nr:hypothetical protein HMPREF9436_01792 [Faecalibacterium cf. prausnitzii KLE1255]
MFCKKNAVTRSIPKNCIKINFFLRICKNRLTLNQCRDILQLKIVERHCRYEKRRAEYGKY